MLSIRDALIMTGLMGAVVLFCRALPFFLFRERGKSKKGEGVLKGDEPTGPGRFAPFLSLVERVAPPVAMTVLALNSVSAPFKESFRLGLPALIASGFTALVHLWKRNSLVSIGGGLLVYLILTRFL
ncbi:MAG: AzlD domain-containing protein [Treponema sp.]|jgi:branched-subunit amino acid transport protein AzlD|nr:AzlD domain-containing protein [Treponema sp.]